MAAYVYPICMFISFLRHGTRFFLNRIYEEITGYVALLVLYYVGWWYMPKFLFDWGTYLSLFGFAVLTPIAMLHSLLNGQNPATPPALRRQSSSEIVRAALLRNHHYY
jgi:hypothetical protein